MFASIGFTLHNISSFRQVLHVQCLKPSNVNFGITVKNRKWCYCWSKVIYICMMCVTMENPSSNLSTINLCNSLRYHYSFIFLRFWYWCVINAISFHFVTFTIRSRDLRMLPYRLGDLKLHNGSLKILSYIGSEEYDKILGAFLIRYEIYSKHLK